MMVRLVVAKAVTVGRMSDLVHMSLRLAGCERLTRLSSNDQDERGVEAAFVAHTTSPDAIATGD
jgi:hypothetical protein